jgi:hypothetical protein
MPPATVHAQAVTPFRHSRCRTSPRCPEMTGRTAPADRSGPAALIRLSNLACERLPCDVKSQCQVKWSPAKILTMHPPRRASTRVCPVSHPQAGRAHQGTVLSVGRTLLSVLPWTAKAAFSTSPFARGNDERVPPRDRRARRGGLILLEAHRASDEMARRQSEASAVTRLNIQSRAAAVPRRAGRTPCVPTLGVLLLEALRKWPGTMMISIRATVAR